MRLTIQFVAILLATVGLALGVPAGAHKQNPNRPPSARTAAPQTHTPSSNPNRPPANQNHVPAATQPNNRPYTPPRQNFNNPPPPRTNSEGARLNPRQQPWVDTMRDLSPRDRERVLQNSRTFQSLSPEKQNQIRQQFSQWDHLTPQQQASIRENEEVWRHLTPEQQQHIKRDVMPRWRQLPWERQQILKQKLRLLQHMPESARNQRLNDPNFTRGLSDDEKSILHDLAHTHVGAPDAQ